jgi:hypothetical protein
MKRLFLAFLISFLWFSLNFGQVAPIDTTNDVPDTGKATDSVFSDNDFLRRMLYEIRSGDTVVTPLEFKGIYLGMTERQVDSLVANSLWAYKYTSINAGIMASKKMLVDDYVGDYYNGPKKAPLKDCVAKIGCEPPTEGGQKCYWLDGAYLDYFQGKVFRISLDSWMWSADKIESSVKDWLRFALKGLIEKYGEPDLTFTSIEEVDIFSFKSGFISYLYKWLKGNARIMLGLSESESKFGCSVVFEDAIATEKVKEQRSQGTPEF